MEEFTEWLKVQVRVCENVLWMKEHPTFERLPGGYDAGYDLAFELGKLAEVWYAAHVGGQFS